MVQVIAETHQKFLKKENKKGFAKWYFLKHLL